MRSIVFIAFTLLLPISAAAFGPDEIYPDAENDTPLSSDDLQSAFSGKTHLGSYNFLYKNISTYAFEETTYKDGRIRHEQDGKVDSGNWNISNDTICYDYDDPTLRQACFKIFLRGNCYYHYVISTEGIPRKGFTARTVISGETPNCEPSYV